MERRDFAAKRSAIDDRLYVDVGAIESVNAVELIDKHGVVGSVAVLEMDWFLDRGGKDGRRWITFSADLANVGDTVAVTGHWSDDGISDSE